MPTSGDLKCGDSLFFIPRPPCPYYSGNLGHYIKSCINYVLSKCSIIVLMQDIIFVSDQIGAKCCRNLTMFKFSAKNGLHFKLRHRKARMLDKINGKPRTPLPPKSRMKNGGFFPFTQLHPWFGGVCGFAVPFYFVQDCSSEDDFILDIKQPVPETGDWCPIWETPRYI